MGAFESYCRIPGTRCNEIMKMIELDIPLNRIAKRYGTDVQTVEVYKKALENKLSAGSPLAYHTNIPEFYNKALMNFIDNRRMLK